MENNIYTSATGATVIMNGGNALPGCPNDWDEARIIEAKLNEGNREYYPEWKFDCGFKLDFDGALIDVSSRFYPPKTHYGSTWDGHVSIRLLGKTIQEKKFDCATVEQLRKEVQEYVDKEIRRIQTIIKNI